MEDYTWKTTEPLPDNMATMADFLDYHVEKHCGEDYEVVHEDGTYAEIQNDDGILYAVNAMGDGDFCSHKVTFKHLE